MIESYLVTKKFLAARETSSFYEYLFSSPLSFQANFRWQLAKKRRTKKPIQSISRIGKEDEETFLIRCFFTNKKFNFSFSLFSNINFDQFYGGY